MLSSVKRHIRGLPWLLMNPAQIKHLIIRETLYRQRNRNRQGWVEWQKYDTYAAARAFVSHSSAIAYARPLNIARIETFTTIINELGKNLTVLDVGCGDGLLSEPIANRGNTVASIDLPTIVKVAQKRHVSWVLAGDAEKLAFADGSFDVVLASEVVEHLWNPHGFFDEAYRVLKSDGWLIVETPEGKEGLRYDSHKNWFTVEIVKQMVGNRFSVQRVKRLEPELGAPTPTIILLLHKNNGKD
jgi:2-polyprenyl-3-methyl-5-hydroxy-6-metoxy-1,4-benzoquinol methylase